jgi:hypothetical protein
MAKKKCCGKFIKKGKCCGGCPIKKDKKKMKALREKKLATLKKKKLKRLKKKKKK